MIQIELHHSFVKSFDKRIKSNPKLVTKTQKRIELFKNNPANQILKDHQLIGPKHNFRAFSITGDIRIVYYQKSDKFVVFLDIGSHNQVY